MGDYQIGISKELIKYIKDFAPTNSQVNSKGGFRRKKIPFLVIHFINLKISMKQMEGK